jgi:hypothetical protein
MARGSFRLVGAGAHCVRDPGGPHAAAGARDEVREKRMPCHESGGVLFVFGATHVSVERPGRHRPRPCKGQQRATVVRSICL